MITVKVEGAWLLVSGAGAGELWIALHDVQAVATCEDAGVWCVVIEQAGGEERRVAVEDEDAAEALACEVRGAKDRAHGLARLPLAPLDLLKLLVLDDIDVQLAGGVGATTVQPRDH